jgi:hypothetical protein
MPTPTKESYAFDLYSYKGDKTQKQSFTDLELLHKQLLESGFGFPEGHLEKFQSYAKAGNVIGIRRPWPEDIIALGQGCALRPEETRGMTLRLDLILSQISALAELLDLKNINQIKEPELKLKLSLHTSNSTRKLPEKDFGERVEGEMLILPFDEDFAVFTYDSKDMETLIGWIISRFAFFLEWDCKESLITELRQLLLPKAPDKLDKVAVNKKLDLWRKANQNRQKVDEAVSGLDDGKDVTPAISLTDGLKASPNLNLETEEDHGELSLDPPRVNAMVAGRVGKWCALSLLRVDGDAEVSLAKVEIPIGLQSTIAVLKHDNEEHTEEPKNNWTEGYHYYALQPIGPPEEQLAKGRQINWHFSSDVQKGSNSSLFRAIRKEDQDSLDNPKELNLFHSGAIIFTPEWRDNAEPQGRMSIHLLRNEEEKKKAMEKYFAADGIDKLEFWRGGRKNAVTLTGYLAAQAYVHVEGKHKSGLTAGVSFLAHEWHELRFADELKKLAFTAGAAGAGIATVLTGGAPLIVAAVGLGVSVALDPFKSRITDASKLTKSKKFVLEEGRIRTVPDPDPAASASKLKDFQEGVKAMEGSKKKGSGVSKFFRMDEPEMKYINSQNKPEDDVKDVGKLLRRAYLHLDIVREKLEETIKKMKQNQVASQDSTNIDALIGESLHHLEKTWRYLAPNVIFASAAYDVYIGIAKNWNEIYTTVEAALIKRIYELQGEKETAWLLDDKQVAEHILKWFNLKSEVQDGPYITGYKRYPYFHSVDVPINAKTNEKFRIVNELNGNQEVIDPVTRKPITRTDDGRKGGARKGYTNGAKVGSELSEWLSNWDFKTGTPEVSNPPKEKIDELSVAIQNLNECVANHLDSFDQLAKEVISDEQTNLKDKLTAAVKNARDAADNPGYTTKTQHYWQNWRREKTKGEQAQAAITKFFGFGLSFGSPLLSAGADQVVKVALSASTNSFFTASKKIGKFATKRQGIKKDIKKSGVLTDRFAAHSALKSEDAKEESFDGEENDFNFELLQSGASFVGTSLVRKVAFRMYETASSLNDLEKSELLNKIPKSDMDGVVDAIKKLYEFHHHMDKLEYYLMGCLTYISIFTDVAETYEKVIFDKLAELPKDSSSNLSGGLENRPKNKIK